MSIEPIFAPQQALGIIRRKERSGLGAKWGMVTPFLPPMSIAFLVRCTAIWHWIITQLHSTKEFSLVIVNLILEPPVALSLLLLLLNTTYCLAAPCNIFASTEGSLVNMNS